MKYLLQAIDARRDCVRLSDHELRDLLIEVRNGKDDRIEFTDSMVRLLEELKGSEHASAFLAKVAKRDAPDYYEVIKNPMDLGTMMRNVRQGRYKSKAQFMRDLDLIWDNCLTYNSEPTHPLRRSVQVLRNKANHLLTYVNDTNDVKEALNQWQASLGLRARAPDVTTLDASVSFGDQLANSGQGERSKTDAAAISRLSVSTMVDTPFEQRNALVRNPDNMETFAHLDASQQVLDREFAQRYLHANEAGPSARRPKPPMTDVEGARLSSSASLDMLKTLEGAHDSVLRAALTLPPMEADSAETDPHGSHVKGEKAENFSIPYAGESDVDDDPAPLRFDPGFAWWNSMSHPSMLPAGQTHLSASERLAVSRPRFAGGMRRGKRRLRQHELHLQENGNSSETGQASKLLVGGVEALERNVQTIGRLRRTHTKYARLHSHIESGEPIPADLGVVSSDEDEEQNEEQTRRNEKAKVRQKAPDALMLSFHDMIGNPFAKLDGESALNMLQSKTNLLLAHAGFDASQKSAADVVTDIASEFLMNVGRTLRNYTDRFSQEMSVEELVLHTLFANGGLDVRSLESYVVDDVSRYGNKMSELLRKLRSSYRDTLAHSDLTMADEAAYFGAQPQLNQNGFPTHDRSGGGDATGNEGMRTSEDEHILRGGYAKELADEDFFGFKDLGLDDELGIDVGRQLAAMPSRMFSRRAQDGAVQGGALAKSRLGPGSGESGSTVLEYEGPEPFVPLSEAAIAAQIGLLRAFYRDLLRTRGQWQRLGNGEDSVFVNGQGDETNHGHSPALRSNPDGPSMGEEEGERRDAYVIVPDEEQERQRYKVPPTGKMPRRAMKQRQPATTTTTTAQGLTVHGTSAGQSAARSKSTAAAMGAQTNGRSSTASTSNKANSKKKRESGSAGKGQRGGQAVTVS